MARRLYGAAQCLEYLVSKLCPAPCLDVELENLLSERYPQPLRFLLDTGFEGCLMVTSEVYEFFKVGELPKGAWRRYRTLSGEVVMRVSHATALVGGKRLHVFVESPVFGVGKILAGREFINKLVIILDGLRRKCCLAEEVLRDELS